VPDRQGQDRQGGDELVAAFARWAADQRAEAAAADRVKERSLRAQASASATWSGILVDLAEQATAVTAVVGAQRRRGRIVGVGPDFCVFEAHLGGSALISLPAMSALWPERTTGAIPPAGARRPALELSLLAALSMLAEERSPVTLVTLGGDEIAGDLIAAGEDVLTVQTDPPARRLAHVRLSALARCELR
jgi:hypothetical protein